MPYYHYEQNWRAYQNCRFATLIRSPKLASGRILGHQSSLLRRRKTPRGSTRPARLIWRGAGAGEPPAATVLARARERPSAGSTRRRPAPWHAAKTGAGAAPRSRAPSQRSWSNSRPSRAYFRGHPNRCRRRNVTYWRSRARRNYAAGVKTVLWCDFPIT